MLDAATRSHERFSLGRDASRWDAYSASFEKALAAYLETIRQGAPPPVPGADGLRELQTEAALRRSASEGRPVRVQEEFPR